MSDIIKCAIIGYGYMGEIRHRVADEHPGLSLQIISESDPSRLNGNYPFQVARDFNDVISSDVDIVFVATPNNLIPEITTRCLETGKHVFCEKPPGRCLDDIVRMQEAEKKNPSSKLMFGFNHRYHPAVLRAKSIVDSGIMGQIVAVRGVYGKSGGKNYHKSWRNDKNISGGGILLDQGIHMLDLFNLFCGNFPEVKAFISNKYWKFDIEDNAMVILKNEKEQVAMLHSSATLWKHTFRINLQLEKGYLVIKGLLSKTGSYGRETLIIGKQQFEDESDAIGNPSEEIIYFDKDLSWDIEVNKFVEYIKNDIPVSESSSLDAFNVMKIIDSAYKDNQI